MSTSIALAKLHQRMDQQKTLLCIGLDSDLAQIPSSFQTSSAPQFAFNQSIIDQTHTLTAAYKFNVAFYESRGATGWSELADSVQYLTTHYPEIFLIADAKRGDIGTTNQAYATALFDELGFDAVTLHPYVGQEALRPFIDRQDKVSIILCRTSNPGAGELQDLIINGQPLWKVVARKVAEEWNQYGNCMLVVGATYPEELASIRQTVGDKVDFLVPGIGTQGGEVAAVLKAGLNSHKQGILLNASRSVIFAPDPSRAAHELYQEIARAYESVVG